MPNNNIPSDLPDDDPDAVGGRESNADGASEETDGASDRTDIPDADVPGDGRSGQTTLIPELEETFVPDPQDTVIPDEGGDGLVERTDPIELEGTVAFESTVGEYTGDVSDEDPDGTHHADPAEKTIDANEIDATVEFEPDGNIQSTQVGESTDDSTLDPNRSVVSTGTGARDLRNEKTKPDSLEGTTEIDFSTGSIKTDVPEDPDSVMASGKIDETINPRELSDQDAAFWGSLSQRESGQDPSLLPPAIDRSFTESKLQIRARHVAPPKSDVNEKSDYRIVRLLGKGGMGNVYVARQGSLDRLLAVKVIKPLDRKKREKLSRAGRLESVEQDRRQQFLSEAVVTGDLDHPNIVPIHDVAVTGDDTLFYSMKRVIGAPWSKEIKKLSLAENLDILQKAADAIGFAHTRGVVHRDIKPENIMKGDFGEVMVMDWGLALPKPEFEKLGSVFPPTGLGGSPAFMAPEMAIGPVDRIGPASDIYLLGATLFMVITGKAPHAASNVSLCLKAAAQNEIRSVAPEHEGELMDIALKAMATEPGDRYSDVKSFQRAIREYVSHSHSIELRRKADADFREGVAESSYADLSRAAFGYEEAIKSWSGNDEAHQGLKRTKLAHAELALQNHDYDLGLSLLDEKNDEHQPIIKKLLDGAEHRDSRQKLVRTLQYAAAAMLAIILVGGSAMMVKINNEKEAALFARNEEEKAKDFAIIARNAEEKAKDDAIIARNAEADAKEKAIAARDAEEEAKDLAIAAKNAEQMAKDDAIRAKDAEAMARMDAEEATRVAIAARNAEENAKKEAYAARDAEAIAKRRAEYEEFVSKIGLAKARIEEHAFDTARNTLEDIEQSLDHVGWEWRWLMSQVKQADSSTPTRSSPEDLSVGRSGRIGVATFAGDTPRGGSVEVLRLSPDGAIEQRVVIDTSNYTAADISSDEKKIATATFDGADGIIELRNVLAITENTAPGSTQGSTDQPFRASRPLGRVTDLQFVGDDLLASASDDRTVRLWNVVNGEEVAICWHIAPVLQIDVARKDANHLVLAAVVGDDSTGKVVVWNLVRDGNAWSRARQGDFLEHSDRVSAIALSADGQKAASGDLSGNLRLWRPDQTRTVNYGQSIKRGINRFRSEPRQSEETAAHPSISVPLIDSDQDDSVQFVSTANLNSANEKAHADAVRTIRFSADGARLLTGSDDYTIKLWDVSARERTKTLKGHGGWVKSAVFLGDESARILSAANDKTIRVWDPVRYVGASVELQRDSQTVTEKEPHREAIWSAQFGPQSSDARKPYSLLSTSRDHTARVFQIDPVGKSFKLLSEFKDDALELSEGSPFVALSMAVRGDRLYVAGADSVVRVWDLDHGVELAQARNTGLMIGSLAISKAGNLMLTGTSLVATDKKDQPHVKAILWDLTDRGPQVRCRLMGVGPPISAFAISPDGTKLFTGDRNGSGQLWDVGANEAIPVKRINDLLGFRINDAKFINGGQDLLIASDNKQMTLIQLESGQSRNFGHDGFVTRLSVSSDERYALTTSETLAEELTTIATLWDLTANSVEKGLVVGKEISSKERKSRVVAAEFGESDRSIVISISDADESTSRVEMWDIDDERFQTSLVQKLQIPLGGINTAVRVDNQLLTLNGESAFAWDIEDKKLRKSYRAHAAVTEGSFSADGKYIITSSRSVKLWDAVSGLALDKLESPHAGIVRSVHFSPSPDADQPYLFATGGDDGFVRTWGWNETTKAFAPQTTYRQTDSSRILAVRFSPDGSKLLAVGTSGVASVWKVAGQPSKDVAPFATFDASVSGALNCGTFSPDGQFIAVGSADGSARMWDVNKPDKPLSRFEPPALSRFERHAGAIEGVAIIQSETEPMRLLTASLDRSARLWDPRLDFEPEEEQERRGREIISLRKHSEGLTAIDVSRDGNIVVTAGRDGKLILWPAEDAPVAEPTEEEGLFDDLVPAQP